jgi:mRNA interferase RelE/StbE
MTYKLEFKKLALKEWKKLDPTIQAQFKKRLQQRLKEPHVKSASISGGKNLYKIKLRQLGYRLVYKVDDKIITVTVLAVGKRERNGVYITAINRLP